MEARFSVSQQGQTLYKIRFINFCPYQLMVVVGSSSTIVSAGSLPNSPGVSDINNYPNSSGQVYCTPKQSGNIYVRDIQNNLLNIASLTANSQGNLTNLNLFTPDSAKLISIFLYTS